MTIFPTVNISKLNFWLVICIAKNFIWTTLKMIFSIFRFFCSSDSRLQIIVSIEYCPIITNHISMQSNTKQLTPYDWFCGHVSHTKHWNVVWLLQKGILKGNEGILKDNSQRSKWQVTGPGGLEMLIPSVCLIIPPPNPLSISLATKYDKNTHAHRS